MLACLPLLGNLVSHINFSELSELPTTTPVTIVHSIPSCHHVEVKSPSQTCRHSLKCYFSANISGLNHENVYTTTQPTAFPMTEPTTLVPTFIPATLSTSMLTSFQASSTTNQPTLVHSSQPPHPHACLPLLQRSSQPPHTVSLS